MKTWDFMVELPVPGGDPWTGGVRVDKSLNTGLLDKVILAPLTTFSDTEFAVALARFAHEELEGFATEGVQISQEESALVLRALNAVLARMGVTVFDPPFRDFNSFKRYWQRESLTGSGSWDARRGCLYDLFEPLHKVLSDREAGSVTSTLATAISPRKVTGWPRVDEEISELRRHFESASTQQDYSNVGNDCVSTLEALSAAVYDHSKHGRPSEDCPPAAKTKERFDRYIEVELTGSTNAELRKLARATVEVAQAVKHRRTTTTRTEAGIAADAVILLANILRRIRSD